MASAADKARKARERASDQNYARGSSSYTTDKLVMDLTRGKAKGLEKIVGRSTTSDEQRAANIMQQRRRIDTGKVAARANAIEKRTAKKKAADTVKIGVSGGLKKAKPVTKKVAAKAVVKKMGKK